MAKKMTPAVAQDLLSVSSLLKLPSFRKSIEDAGYCIDDSEIDKLRSEANLIIAKDAIKKAGFAINEVLINVRQEA